MHGAGERVPRRLGVAAVVEAAAVPRPAGAGELDPAEVVAQVAAAGHVAHVELLPVGAGGGGAVHQAPSVARDGEGAERHRAVLREGVGVQQQARLGVEGVEGVEHRLVLQPVVAEEEVAAALAEGDAELLVVPQPRQALADRLALRDLLQVAEGDAVLRLHPRAGLRAVGLLQPAVGVGHARAVVVVDLRTARGDRVVQLLRGGARRQARQQQRRQDEGTSQCAHHGGGWGEERPQDRPEPLSRCAPPWRIPLSSCSSACEAMANAPSRRSTDGVAPRKSCSARRRLLSDE